MKPNFSEDEYINEFFIRRDSSQSTRNSYLLRLKKYSEFTQMTPTELILEAEKDEDQIKRRRNRKINKHLLGFKERLKEDGKTFNTIKTYMATIKGFYHEFDIETPRIEIKDREEKTRTTTQDIVGKEHIKEALKHSNIKYSAIILMMSSSGMGSAEIRHLTWHNFLKAISDYLKPVEKEQFDIPYITETLRSKRSLILTWNIRRYKTGHLYTTFTTPEANLSLLDYLDERHRENKPAKGLDDTIFLSKKSIMPDNTLGGYFKQINDTCNFGFVGKYRFFTSHKLRKFFASTLNIHRVPVLITRWLMGHNVDTKVDAYFKPNIDTLKKEYTRLIPYLSIEKVSVRDVTSKEYDKLLRNMEEMEQKNKKRDKILDDLLSNPVVLKELGKKE